MSQVKVYIDGKERTIAHLGNLDMEKPTTAKMLEMMCKAGDKAKQDEFIRIPSGEPVNLKNRALIRKAFKEYFSE